MLRQKIDSVTTYMVLTVGLLSLVGLTLFLSWLGVLTYSSPGTLLLTLLVLLSVSFLANLLFTKLYRLPFTQGPTLITALILFFVLSAPTSQTEWFGIAFAALVAIASKYVVTWRGANIFNPAAFGVYVVSLIGIGYGAWWVASEVLFIPVLVLGAIVLLKLRRFQLFFAFFVPALVLILLQTFQPQWSLPGTLIAALTLYPLIFLGTVMLTEPGTMPATNGKRLAYGVIVGLVFGAQFDSQYLSTSPHIALLVGNVFALLVTSRSSVRLMFAGKKRLSPTTYEFTFKPDKPVAFLPGQYMEFSLPGLKSDSRGNRRTFTIVSSPQEKLIRIAVKFYQPGSWFKKELMALKDGQEIIGNHVAGDFTLPKETTAPLAFIAGGVGITPYISMLEHITHNKLKHSVSLYYVARNEPEIVYKDILRRAESYGVKVHIRTGDKAVLTEGDLTRHSGEHFYLSGPPGFVSSYKAKLKTAKPKTIHTDYFSGY